MNKLFLKICCCISLVTSLSVSGFAQSSGSQPHNIEELTKSIGDALKREYIFPEVGQKISELLEKNTESGAYAKYRDYQELGERLTQDIRSINNDAHLSLMYTSPAQNGRRMIRRGGAGSQISPQALQSMKRSNFGFESAKILEGNIGYVNITSFVDPAYAGETAVATMQFLSNTDAVIFDLRENRGGAGEMYQLLASYLLDNGPTQLNEIYWPADKRRYQTWTLPHVPGKKLAEQEIYILTSGSTGSAAEVFSYSLKHLERATVIGEVTRGVANPVSPTKVSGEFTLWLSKGEAKNPVTKTNWEGKGVVPHIKTDKAQALEVAHQKALGKLAQKYPDSKRFYQWHQQIASAQMRSVKISDKQLSSYAGVYVSPSGEERVVTVTNGKLFYGPDMNSLTEMTPLSKSTFMIEGDTGFKLEFDAGRVKAKNMKRLFESGRIIPMKRK